MAAIRRPREWEAEEPNPKRHKKMDFVKPFPTFTVDQVMVDVVSVVISEAEAEAEAGDVGEVNCLATTGSGSGWIKSILKKAVDVIWPSMHLWRNNC